MMKLKPSALNVGLFALSFELTACAHSHRVKISEEIMGKVEMRECSAVSEGATIRYARFGSPGRTPLCGDPVRIAAFNGVNSDAATWAPFAAELNEEDRDGFMAVDLSGKGIAGLELNPREVNPLSIAQKLRGFLSERLSDVGSPILLGHSAGGAVAILSSDQMDVAETIVFNPVLGAKSADVYLPSRMAPYACNLPSTSSIIRRGVVAERTRLFAPGLLALKEEGIGEAAQSTNVCLRIVDEEDELLLKPCEQTPVRRLERDLLENCDMVKAYANSVRSPAVLNKWSPYFNRVKRNPNNKYTIIVNKTDGVLNPERAIEIAKNQPNIKVIRVDDGPHEAITLYPNFSAKAFYRALNSLPSEDTLLADQ